MVGSIRGCEKGRGATQKILSTTLDDRYIYIDLYRYTYIDRRERESTDRKRERE